MLCKHYNASTEMDFSTSFPDITGDLNSRGMARDGAAVVRGGLARPGQGGRRARAHLQDGVQIQEHQNFALPHQFTNI